MPAPLGGVAVPHTIGSPLKRVYSEVKDQVGRLLKGLCTTILNHGAGNLSRIYSGEDLVVGECLCCALADLDCDCSLVGALASSP